MDKSIIIKKLFTIYTYFYNFSSFYSKNEKIIILLIKGSKKGIMKNIRIKV